jgi:hypothetical protein
MIPRNNPLAINRPESSGPAHSVVSLTGQNATAGRTPIVRGGGWIGYWVEGGNGELGNKEECGTASEERAPPIPRMIN